MRIYLSILQNFYKDKNIKETKFNWGQFEDYENLMKEKWGI